LKAKFPLTLIENQKPETFYKEVPLQKTASLLPGMYNSYCSLYVIFLVEANKPHAVVVADVPTSKAYYLCSAVAIKGIH